MSLFCTCFQTAAKTAKKSDHCGPKNFLFDFYFFVLLGFFFFFLIFWLVMPQWLVSGHPTPTTMPAGHNGKINLRYCWHSNNAAEVKSRVSTKKPKQQSWLRTEFEKALDSLRARAFVAFFPSSPFLFFFPRFFFLHLLTSKPEKPLSKMPTLGQQHNITNA